MDQRYWIEISLKELENVNPRLSILSLKADPSFLQVSLLIKQAQSELGLLEPLLKDTPNLIHAQIGLLEALVLAQQSKPGEAIQKAYSYLHWFLKSTEHLR